MKSIALYYNLKRVGGNLLNRSESADKDKAPTETVKPQQNSGATAEPLTHGNEPGGASGDKISKEKSTPTNTELHINVWKVEKGKMNLSPVVYMDFGIMFPCNYQTLCLYLPFEIDGDPMDLSEILRTNDQTLGAVFNSDVQVTSRVNDNYCTVSFIGDEKRKFYLYKLGETNFTTEAFKKAPKGMLIKITIDSTPTDGQQECKQKYVRFRVKLKDKEQYIKSEHISNDLLQAAFSKTDLFDVRVNENRVLDSKVKETMKLNGFEICKFDKIHMFYMVDTRETVHNGSSLKQDTRILEEDQWDKYTPETDLHHTTFVAYHWKKRRKENDGNSDGERFEDAPISNFSVFFSSVYPRFYIWRFLAYAGMIILMGWGGSMLTFHFGDVKCVELTSYVRPGVVAMVIAYIALFMIFTMLGFEWFKIYRKR